MVRLSMAIGRSPWRTWISTDGWLSLAVENVSLLRVGIVVLAGISVVMTAPSVSMPRLSGVTSSSSTSLTSPERTPPWMAAPMATTSSGLTLLLGALPKNSRTTSCTFGIRVEPPTRRISSIWSFVSPASSSAFCIGGIVREMRSSTSCSSLERERSSVRCFGPSWVAVMNGRLIVVLVELESSILAFSAASLRRWRAIGSCRRSMPSLFWNSSAIQSMRRWSKSSPPRWVSPFVDFTSKTPSPSSRMEMS